MTSKHDEALERYLGGELPLEELPEDERAEELRLRDALGALREEARAPAGFRADVMRAVAAIDTAEAPFWRRLVDFWLQPQSVRIRPAVGLALAAAAALVLVVRQAPAPAPTPEAASATEQSVTRFVLVAPQASSVHLTGDFVSWSPDGIALEDPRGTGVWTADVALPPGVYQYTFVVNGTDWTADPRAVSQVDDGFGQMNSVVIVPAGEA
jgi:hypothetical protein